MDISRLFPSLGVRFCRCLILLIIGCMPTRQGHTTRQGHRTKVIQGHQQIVHPHLTRSSISLSICLCFSPVGLQGNQFHYWTYVSLCFLGTKKQIVGDPSCFAGRFSQAESFSKLDRDEDARESQRLRDALPPEPSQGKIGVDQYSWLPMTVGNFSYLVGCFLSGF